uniref:L-serine ammonia-lyase n=1 Tax=Onchocerca volvulus TaxID=6282 RepID=A0A2K6VTQ1_ONCVO
MFSFVDICAASDRISGTIHKTPVMTSSYINSLFDMEVYFKCDHLQKTGSFKARGALNAVKMIINDPENKCSSVITHSSGNFGQALAWAAKIHNIPCTVVAPNNAPMSKINAMKAYGANIVFCEPKNREVVCKNLCDKGQNIEMVHPFDDYRVMAGQGTIAVEFMEQIPDLDALLVAVGGGGLCSGIVVAAKNIKPTIKVYCVEPEGKELQHSFDSNKRAWDPDAGPVNTIADGIRVLRVGEKCFPHITEKCEKKILTVNDDDIIQAMKLVYSRMKQAIEPTGAVSLAALFKYKDELTAQNLKKIGAIFCGGNIDLEKLSSFF